MKILIISAVFPPEPVVSAKLSFDLALALCFSNDVTVISPKPTRPFKFNFNNNPLNFPFNHIVAESYTCPEFNVIGRLRETYSFGKFCMRYIKNHHTDIDVIYSNTWPLFAQFLVVRAAKNKNIPVIVHVQDIYPESLTNILPVGSSLFRKILMPIDKYNLRNATNIIAISDKMKFYLMKTRNLKKKNITVVQNWQDESNFIDNKLNSEDIFTFMYLGNIGPLAGVENLIEAFVLAKTNNSRLIIAGSGSMKDSLIKRANEFGDYRIEFWDVPENMVHDIQSVADVLLLPIKKGGASNSIPSKLAAYMLSRKPILASVDMDSDTANAIIQGTCGWIVTPENIDELAIAMRSIISTSKDELAKMGKHGYNYAIENMSKKNNLPRLISIINNTFDRK